MLIGNLWINSHSQKNILTVAAYIAHTCKRLVITGGVVLLIRKRRYTK